MDRIGQGTLQLSQIVMLLGVMSSVFYGPKALALWGLALPLFLAAWMFARLGGDLPGRKRDLLLHADGTISSTTGLAGVTGSCGRWRVQQADIASIEAEQLDRPSKDGEPPYAWGVKMYLTRGAVIRVSQKLDQRDAHELTMALNLIREDLKYENEVSAGQPAFDGAVW